MLKKIQQYCKRIVRCTGLGQGEAQRSFWRRCLQVVLVSFRNFLRDQCGLHSSVLTYYTLMALIPLLALFFAIAKGLHYSGMLRTALLERFHEQSAALREAFQLADRLLAEAEKGPVAAFGVGISILMSAFLVGAVESVMNRIWKVQHTHFWGRTVSKYFALLLIGPIYFVLASSASIFVLQHLSDWIGEWQVHSWVSMLLLFIIRLIPYTLFWVLFAFVYYVMPNAPVRFRFAVIAGGIAAACYLLGNWGYFYFQKSATSYDAIYGGLAALPLFLIWMQLSWFIFLFGVEVNYTLQTEGHVSSSV